MPERPLLTANWSDLLLLSFPVPTAVVERIAPPGTEPDLHDGQAYISIVGFRFHAVRLFGLAVPGHTCFNEINLRYYVRRIVGTETRRGVVFAREIAPRRAVALIANWLYHENYITRPMHSEVHLSGAALAPGDTIEYAWRSKIPLPCREGQGEGSSAPSPIRRTPLSARIPRLRLRDLRWNRLAARVTTPLALPTPNSLEEFIVEHYWGYARARDGTTREYRVTHDPWYVAPADNITWDCDVSDFSNSPPRPRGGASSTDSTSLAQYLASPPTSAIIAAGSPIQLHRGRRL